MPRPAPAIAVACLLAACGGSEPRTIALVGEPGDAQPAARTRSTQPLDACALLTKADVAEVAGEEPRNPKPAEPSPQLPGSEMEGSTCQYRGEGWRLLFFVERGHTKESKNATRTPLKNWQRVSGLGEEAYWGQADPNKPGTMTAFDGTHAIVVNWFVRGGKVGPGTLENTTKLVRKALSRL